MNLLQISRFLAPLDESIDIHGLAKRFKANPNADQEAMEQSVKDYRSTIQGRKKELLKPFGLDDLDKFKDDPNGFVKMVGYAKDSFAEKKEQASLYKRVYEDDHCLITMPKGPKGTAAAGSLLKEDGVVVCPWCVAIKYPDNENWWRRYNAEAIFFVYAKENGVVSDAWCLVLTLENCYNVLNGRFTISQIENTDNDGNGDTAETQTEFLNDIMVEAKMEKSRLLEVFAAALAPRRQDLERRAMANMLSSAAKNLDIKACKHFVAKGADLNTEDNHMNTPLMIAAELEGVELLEFLISAGADVNARNSNEYTALHKAAENAKPDCCRILLKAGANVNATTSGGITPLMNASKAGRVNTCKLLVDAGADIDATNIVGCTALMYAANYANPETCKVLVDAGADVNIRDNKGWNALLFGSFRGRTESCEIIIDAGAELDCLNEYGNTALMTAAKKGRIKLCRLLADAGASMDIPDRSGDTPLKILINNHYDCFDCDICSVMVKRGANVNFVVKSGKTLLMWAAERNETELCKDIIAAGAKINAGDYGGETALMIAAENKNAELCKDLIKAGADVNARNNRGLTALYYANLYGATEISRMLEEAGAKE